MLRGAKLPSSIFVRNGRFFFSRTCYLLLEQSAEERAREEELRQKVQQKYRGMQIPPITNHQYGHFASMGINETAAHQAAGDARFQDVGNADGQRFQSGEMPLWTASVEMQAKHLLFSIQFKQDEQDQLKKEFEIFRQTHPLVSFFDWVRSRRPEFCSGRKYNCDYVLNALVSFLRSNDKAHLASLVGTLQQSMGRQTSDSLQRVDDFVDRLQSTGYLFQAMRGTEPTNAFALSYPPAPALMPSVEHAQGGAEKSDLNSALEAKNDEAHSSIPFDGTK